MSKALRLAIYSGNIPSTTFIERLIEGVANSGHKVLLFGVLSRKPKYQAGIEVLGYRNSKMAKLFYLWRYSILLLLFNFKRKQQLDCFLKEDFRGDRIMKTTLKCGRSANESR